MKRAEILRLTFAMLWLAQVGMDLSIKKKCENAIKDEMTGKPQKPYRKILRFRPIIMEVDR